MTNRNGMSCLICGERIEAATEEYSTVSVAENREYHAHKDCIEALKAMLGKVTLRTLEFPETAPDLVQTIYSEGWFSKSRKLREVIEQCRRRGFNFDQSTIANVLKDFTRRGLLTREGKTKDYLYIQKMPT